MVFGKKVVSRNCRLLITAEAAPSSLPGSHFRASRKKFVD
jgi:hypothetical protein